MRQKICLMPIDRESKLLREKPKSWDVIKVGKFMIINGQHNITASKELQISGCGDKCHVELSKWEAYIVWSLDPIKLMNISKFYNSTNHLEHAQPTWDWQLISSRNIWITHGQPTDKEGKHEQRANHVGAQSVQVQCMLLNKYQKSIPLNPSMQCICSRNR